MAWTTTKNAEYGTGNLKCQLWYLTADSATLELDTGLDFVVHVAATPASATSSMPNFQRNVLSAGTSSKGNVAVTGATSGDDLFLTVWGR